MAEKVLKEIQGDLPEETSLDDSLRSNLDLILKFANECPMKDPKGAVKYGWQTNWKDETRIDNILKEGENYFEVLKTLGSRKLVSQEHNMQALELVEILKYHNRTKDYFTALEGIEIIFQLEIFTEIDGIKVKGALDIFRINHKNKTWQIVDLKKAFSMHQFLENVKRFDYLTQLSFYTELVYKFIEEERSDLKDYTELPPINIAIDVSDKIPGIFEYTKTDLNLSKNGNADLLHKLYGDVHIFKIKKGWLETLHEIKWHKDHNNFEESKEMIEKNKIVFNMLNI